jgi:hypothetical protein
VKSKRPAEAAAKDLYTSELFRGRRAFVERTCDRWYILSAKHHLLAPDQVVAPYDRTLLELTPGDRQRWSMRVLDDLRAELGELSEYEFEIHAGDEYRSNGLRDGLDRASALSVYPVAGLKYGEQVRFYTPVSPVGGGTVVAGFRREPQRAREAAQRLWAAWNGDGIFGVRSMPESRPPNRVERGSRDHALFLTLTVAIDYMRDASALWEAARSAYDDVGTRWLFEPRRVASAEPSLVLEALIATRLAIRPQQDSHIWRTVSETLERRFSGDPREIASTAGEHGPRIIEELRRIPGDFPWLQGRKIAPLWVRMLADELGLPITGLDDVAIPVDVHIARATFACGGLVGSFRGTVSSTAGAVEDLWRDALDGTGLYPLQIDQALWLQSREGCSRRRESSCPRETECSIADLCVTGDIRTEGDTLIVDTRTTDDHSSHGPGTTGVNAEQVWSRIVANAGQTGFRSQQGVGIIYDIDAGAVEVRERRGARIPRRHFEIAISKVPLRTLRDVPENLWGRSYIFAILMDSRIRRDEW